VSSRLVDLSHTIEDGITTYPGLPGPPNFRLYAVPPKVRGMGTFPVRAHALPGQSRLAS
jgi:kynurenine formamidase